MRIPIVTVRVLDQQEAFDFYTEKLGFIPREDMDLGAMRWLTVSPPDQPEIEILLERLGPPMIDDESRAAIDMLIAKGIGSSLFLAVDDCRASYEELVAKGVEFYDEPTERFYGIDAGFRDNSGNPVRMTQRVATGIAPPS